MPPRKDRRRYPTMLTVAEVARILGISRNTLYKLAAEFRRTGGLSGVPNTMAGGSVRFSRPALLKYLDPYGLGEEDTL